MHNFFSKIIPVLLIFVLGIILRRLKVLSKEDADKFLNLVLFVSLPALTLNSFQDVVLSFDYILLPIIAVIEIISMLIISHFIGKKFNFHRKRLGTFIIGASIMNLGFALPFFIAAYGSEGFALATIFDLGNSFLIFTLVYFIAMKFGNSSNNHDMYKKFLHLPPIWALLIAIILNLFHIRLPVVISEVCSLLGSSTIAMIMLSLGIYFSPKLINIKYVATVIFLRMGLGFLMGLLFSTIFSLEGLPKIIVIISSTAPVGYNTLVFSTLENLDKRFAATLVSFSLLLGICIIPIMIFFLK